MVDDHRFNTELVSTLIDNLKHGKAPDIDGLSADITAIRHSTETCTIHLTCAAQVIRIAEHRPSPTSRVVILHCVQKKVNHCIHIHTSDKQCRILAKFCNNNATSNCKQNAKFQ